MCRLRHKLGNAKKTDLDGKMNLYIKEYAKVVRISQEASWNIKKGLEAAESVRKSSGSFKTKFTGLIKFLRKGGQGEDRENKYQPYREGWPRSSTRLSVATEYGQIVTSDIKREEQLIGLTQLLHCYHHHHHHHHHLLFWALPKVKNQFQKQFQISNQHQMG